ncbi:MAG: hypothetical protein AAFZ63_27970 [Bacteroidota bacterium]
MFLTPTFTKALSRLTMLCLLISLWQIVSFKLGIHLESNTVKQSPAAVSILLLIPNALCIGGFWYSIYFLTQEKLGVILAAILHYISSCYQTFIMIGVITHPLLASLNGIYSAEIIGTFIALTVFAVIHYRDVRLILLFSTFYLLVQGLKVPAFPYFNFVEGLWETVGLENAFSFERIKSDGRISRINMLSILYGYASLLIWLVCFWFLHRRIIQNKRIDFKFLQLPDLKEITPTTFSIIHWSFRMILFVLIFGCIRKLDAMSYGHFLLQLVWIICLFSAIYIVASIYRNLIVSYLSSRGRSPKWVYFFLQVPFLHIFAWFYAVRLPRITPTEHEDSILALENSSPNMSLHRLQERFRLDRNREVKAWTYILVILGVIVRILRRFQASNAILFDDPILDIAILIGGVLLIFWFIQNALALYYIVGVIAIISIIGTLAGSEELLIPIIVGSFVNCILYYALFHFDQFKMEENSGMKDSDTLKNAVQSDTG